MFISLLTWLWSHHGKYFIGILLIFTDSLSLVTPGAAPYQTLSLQSPNSTDVTKNGHQRARVLYDYDAKDATELSLMADEVTQSHQLGFYSHGCLTTSLQLCIQECGVADWV